MFETICEPYGKAAFPTVVKCDTCGERLYEGLCDYECEHHWCDEKCKPIADVEAEFRTCTECGRPMVQGFTVEGGGWYCCDDCFEKAMDADYPLGWEPNSHEEDTHWCDGYYDYKAADGSWHDTGIFYTEWY